MKIHYISKNVLVEDDSSKSNILVIITLAVLFVLFYLIDCGYILL